MNGINTNISNFDWTSALNSALKANGVGESTGIAGTGVIDGDNLNITVKDANGNAVSMTVENPTLDPATGEPDSETLQKIQDKLNGLVDDLKAVYEDLTHQVQAANLTSSSTGTEKVLFDIYQLISLMIEIAQQQREVARNERYADLTVQTASIQSQADAQRQAATTGLIMSCCLSAVSIACSLGMAIKSATASTKAVTIEVKTGCDQARTAYGLAQSRTTADADVQLAKVEGKMTQPEIKAAQEHFHTSDAAKAQLDRSKTTLETYVEGQPDLEALTADSKKTFDAKTAELEQAKADLAKLTDEQGKADAELKKAEAAYDAGDADPNVLGEGMVHLKEGMDAARAKVDTLAEQKVVLDDKIKKLEGELKTAKGEYDRIIDHISTKNTRVQALNEAVKSDKAAYEATLNGDMKALDGKLEIAQGKLEAARQDGTPKETVKDLEKEVAALEKEATWGRAHVTREFHANEMTASVEKGIVDAKANYDQKKDLLKSDAEYKKATADANKYNAYSQIANQLNGICQSLTQYTTGSKEAEATAKQKEQKEAEAAREESSDLFNSAKELLDSVLKLMSSVQQAENQSIQQILA